MMRIVTDCWSDEDNVFHWLFCYSIFYFIYLEESWFDATMEELIGA